MRALEEKARELDITDLEEFYASNVFTSSAFKLRDDNTIVYKM